MLETMPETIEQVAIGLTVNGKPYSMTVEPRMLLVDLIREHGKWVEPEGKQEPAPVAV